MAYNNGFPMSYQPYYTPQVQQQQSGIIWVQGEAGAKSYLVAPNNTVQLWDSESQTIYLKSADASGMPSMRILDYTIRDNAPVNPQKGQAFATVSEISRLEAEIERLKERMIKISGGEENGEKSNL